MTIRKLIEMGFDIDTELCIETKVYDNEGNHQGTYFSYCGIENCDCDTENMIILQAHVTPTT